MPILIIDDDAGIRQLLTLFLRQKGYTARYAANGAEALEQLQNSESLPQLLLLDLMMPVMDGVEFRQKQQADPRLAEIPVVFISAMENLQANSLLLTATAYLPKPINFDALLNIVEQYCSPQST